MIKENTVSDESLLTELTLSTTDDSIPASNKKNNQSSIQKLASFDNKQSEEIMNKIDPNPDA